MAHRKHKILVLTSTYPRNNDDATPAFVAQLCARLDDTFDVHVLAPHSAGLATTEAGSGVTVHRYMYAPARWETLAYDGGILNRIREKPGRFALVPSFLVSQLCAAAVLCRRLEIDAIHAHWIVPQGLIGVIVARMCGIPVIVTAHGGDLYGLKGKWIQKLKRWVMRACTHLTTVSESMKKTALSAGIEETKVSVASMGVDLKTLFVPGSLVDKGCRLLFVGRLVEKKGLVYLLKAMKQLTHWNTELRLDVVGDGPQRAAMEELARSEGLSEHVSFLGARNAADLVWFYQNAIVFVMPSVIESGGDQEGLGLVAVEAMGCECPVVASDLPAIRDVVRDEETGLLAREKDPVDLARKIEWLLDDDNYREELGKKGREYVLSRFDWSIVGERYRRLIAQIIEQNGRK